MWPVLALAACGRVGFTSGTSATYPTLPLELAEATPDAATWVPFGLAIGVPGSDYAIIAQYIDFASVLEQVVTLTPGSTISAMSPTL